MNTLKRLTDVVSYGFSEFRDFIRNENLLFEMILTIIVLILFWIIL